MVIDDRLTEVLRTHVALADEPFDDVVWIGVDYLTYAVADDGGEVDEAAIERTVWELTDALFAEHLTAQAAWPAVTDNDRLSAVFGELGRTGVATRQAFTCCQNCGHSEILDGFNSDERPRAYVFFHQQDAERGVLGQGVHLAYDAPQALRTTFAGQIVESLKRNGLRPEWDGSADTRIFVPLAWQRRRVGALAAHPGALSGPDFEVTVEPIGWDGPPVIAGGARSAKAWAALRLPWLPTGTSVRVTAGDRTTVVRREWDRLVDDHGTGVGRHDALTLLAAGVPAVPVTAEPDLLEVTYAQRGYTSNGKQIPMTLGECRWLLRTAPVHPRGFTTYTSRSGAVVQHSWNADGTLWLEFLDPAARASHGRLAEPAEVDQVIAVLALEDRVCVADLGPLETTTW